MTTDPYRGRARVSEAAAMRHYSSTRDNPKDALGETTENGVDAGANTVYVELGPDRVVIIDSGSGMVSNMYPSDHETLEIFSMLARSGDIPPGYNFFDEVQPVSLISLQYMMEGIGRSRKNAAHARQKAQATGRQLRGTKGTGLQNARSIGANVVYYTRPNAELAQQRWGNQWESFQQKTWKLTPPTMEQLERDDISYTIEESDEPLTDPNGKIMPSGTKVVITNLWPGVTTSLRYRAVIDYLSGKHGQDLRNQHLKLVVIDTASSTTTHVQPTPYRGIQVVQRAFYLPGGAGPFEAELYYSPNERGNKIELYRQGQRVNDLTNLEGLDIPPWNTGQVGGRMEFPDIDDTPWNLTKTVPLASRVYNQWKQVLERIAQEVSQAIAESEERAKERRLHDLTSAAAQIAVDVMKGMPDFQDVVINSGPTGPKTPRQRRPNDRVIASVVNEHGEAVPGISVRLSQSDQHTERVTGNSGTLSFGKLEDGLYRLRVIPNEGMNVIGMDEVPFTISGNQPGIRTTFHLITGQEKKEPKKIPGLKVRPVPWAQTDEPYRTRYLHNGLLEINTESDAMRQAIAEGDVARQLDIIALCIAFAMTEYAYPDEPSKVTHQKGIRLYQAMRPQLTKSWADKQRKDKAA